MLNNASSSRLWPVLIASACIFLLSPGLCAKSYPMPKRQLTRQLLETIAKVRNGKTLNSRTDAAEHLAMLTRGINPHKATIQPWQRWCLFLKLRKTQCVPGWRHRWDILACVRRWRYRSS